MPATVAEQAHYVRERLPAEGLFAGQHWRISPEPLRLNPTLVDRLERLGPILLQFYQSLNLLYRQSVNEKQPSWVAAWLDQGKPEEMIRLQRAPAFRQEIPRVIRPDILLTDEGFSITELDNVPGGIGLTAWLNETYEKAGWSVLGGSRGMLEGFAGIFEGSPRAHVVVSEEAATYKPEMDWLCTQLNQMGTQTEFSLRDTRFKGVKSGDAVYRFFEMFDLANVESAQRLIDHALAKKGLLTPPPKPFLEEKLILALLWNGHLQEFWRRHLGGGYWRELRRSVPYTWVVDPTPLPPHGAIPDLELVSWEQLKSLSQKERELILKISGFSGEAWGSRGVFLGSDLSSKDWAAAVDRALNRFSEHPYVLQRFTKPTTVNCQWFDFEADEVRPMLGRVRLCPYYFVKGQGDTATVRLGGVLATICSADKKIIHGMKEAILAPCALKSPNV